MPRPLPAEPDARPEPMGFVTGDDKGGGTDGAPCQQVFRGGGGVKERLGGEGREGSGGKGGKGG